MPALADSGIIGFGPFLLDIRARTLLAGGEKVPVSSRALDILVVLAENRDRVVSKDEIIAKVWRGVVVEENNLAVQISALRRALSEHGARQSMILTVAGQGYRFVADVETSQAPKSRVPPTRPLALPPDAPATPSPDIAPRRGWRRWVTAGVAALALGCLCAVGLWFLWRTPSPPRLSLAVLPFRNLTDDKRLDYLADAVTDDLTTDLSHLPGSTVIARESSDVYKDHAAPAEQIGRALHVRYLLEGSLRGVDDVFRVNAQLIDAATGAHLWSDKFDRPRDNPAEAQAAIVNHIASALDVKLVAIESARSQRERPRNPDAMDLYLRARALRDSAQGLDQLTQAQHLLEQAIRLQPGYVEAEADLSLVLLQKAVGHDDRDQEQGDRAQAQSLIEQVLVQSPANAVALTAKGILLNRTGQSRESEASLEAALAADPTNVLARSFLAYNDMLLGQPEKAVEAWQAVLQLDPQAQGQAAKKRMSSLGMAYFLSGKYQDAITWLLRSLADDPANASGGVDRVEFSNMFLIAAYDRIGDKTHAQALYETYRKTWPHRSIWRLCSYFSKAEASLPGFRALREGLLEAGMPEFEHAPTDNEPPTPDSQGDFAMPPAHIEGARPVTVAALPDLLAQAPKPLLIDVGSGAAAARDATWVPFPDDASAGLAVQLRHVAKGTPVIVIGDGYYGTGFEAATRQLVRSGLSPVFWLVGGEEALAAGGYPTQDRRDP
jgi:TolB-like protein/DNA-binding winged helix-turn-helix (wHTH) protein